jgi:hypothetical protein
VLSIKFINHIFLNVNSKNDQIGAEAHILKIVEFLTKDCFPDMTYYCPSKEETKRINDWIDSCHNFYGTKLDPIGVGAIRNGFDNLAFTRPDHPHFAYFVCKRLQVALRKITPGHKYPDFLKTVIVSDNSTLDAIKEKIKKKMSRFYEEFWSIDQDSNPPGTINGIEYLYIRKTWISCAKFL